MPVRSRPRRAVALLASATIASGSVALAAPTLATAAPSGCAATFNLFIPGTWETNETADPSQVPGMLAPVAAALKAEHGAAAEVYSLPYMARAFDNGHTYADSKIDGIERAGQVLTKIANSCPSTKFTITGYSQGADVAGDLASAIGNNRGPIDASRVLAVGLLADPGSGTKGSATVGPRTSGQGIADPRPQGMGTLSGRVASICDPGDLYCSIEKGNSPLLGSLGTVLSKAPSSTVAADITGNTQLATALTSDFSDVDLPGLGGDVATLNAQLAEPNVNITKVSSTAAQIINTIAPVADLIDSGAANPAANGQLATAAAGTPESSASQVLTSAGDSDLIGALTTANSVVTTADRMAGGDSLTLPSTAPEVQKLAQAAELLGGQVAPLTSTSSDALTSATSVLSVLKPTVVVNQALNVATGITSLDMPGILANLALLPQKVAALDAKGAHAVAGELNNQFSPLVLMAAEVDMKWVSQVLSIIPDPTGTAQIAALVTSILGGVDVIRLANIVGEIQEIAWAAVEKLLPPPGQLPDPVGAAGEMGRLIPVGLDLASVAVNMVSGTPTKTSPALLGKSNAAAVNTSITSQAQSLSLPQLTNSLSTIASSPGIDDLTTLVSDGLSAATFFASGSHTNYGSLVVDNAGRDAISWLGDWLNLQIGRAA